MVVVVHLCRRVALPFVENGLLARPDAGKPNLGVPTGVGVGESKNETHIGFFFGVTWVFFFIFVGKRVGLNISAARDGREKAYFTDQGSPSRCLCVLLCLLIVFESGDLSK